MPLGLAPTQSAFAQAGGIIVERRDDGSGAEPQMMMFSLPDIHGVSQPDYVHADLPVFHESLLLSEEQQNQLRILLEAYLESFRVLREQLIPAGAMPMMAFGGPMGGGGAGLMIAGGGEDGEGGEFAGPGDAFVFATAGGEEGIDFELPEGAEDGNFSMAVMVVAGDGSGEGGDGGGGAGGGVAGAWAPAASVSIDATGANGEELTEEQLAEIEELARKLTEKIQQQLEEHMAAHGGELPPPPPMPDPDEMQRQMDEMAAAAEKLAKAKEQLKSEFLAQVRTMLAEAQIERWPTFERAMTRHKTMHGNRLDGEDVDLFKLLNRLDWSDEQRAKLQEALDRYEIALHEALTARNDFVPKAQKEMDEAMRSGSPAAAIPAVERAANLRVRVRNTNEQYAEEMAVASGDEAGSELRDSFRRAAYPRVYRTTFAQRTYDAALALEDLSADVRSAIESQHEAYQLELDILNEKIRGAIRRAQPDEPKQMLEHLAAEMAGEDDGPMGLPGMGDEPVSQAFAERSALDDRHVEQLQHLLTAEQLEKLPKKRTRTGPQILRIEKPQE